MIDRPDRIHRHSVCIVSNAVILEGGAMGSALRIQIFPVLGIAVPLAVVLAAASSVMGQTPPPPASHVTTTGTPTGTPGTPGGGITAPQPQLPPSAEFGFEESLPLQQGGLREEESFPERVRGVFAPAFLRSGSTTVRTSRTSGMQMGFSGWTSTRIPYDDRNNGGGPAFGFTIQWGKPLPPPAEPAPKEEAPAPR
jgi:hypothetical protein